MHLVQCNDRTNLGDLNVRESIIHIESIECTEVTIKGATAVIIRRRNSKKTDHKDTAGLWLSREEVQSVEPTLLGRSRTHRSAPTCSLWTMVRLGGGPLTNSDRVIPKVRARITVPRASLDRKPGKCNFRRFKLDCDAATPWRLEEVQQRYAWKYDLAAMAAMWGLGGVKKVESLTCTATFAGLVG